MSRVTDARDHLGAALIQALPSDDQIIIGHVRDAHRLLKLEARERRAPGIEEARLQRELRLARAALQWAELHAERALLSGPDACVAFAQQMTVSGELARKVAS